MIIKQTKRIPAGYDYVFNIIMSEDEATSLIRFANQWKAVGEIPDVVLTLMNQIRVAIHGTH